MTEEITTNGQGSAETPDNEALRESQDNDG